MRPRRGIAGVLPLVIVCATATGTMVATEQSVDPPRLLFAERPAILVLIAGRWLRAWTTDGPWQVVARSDLPSDILAIADNSPVWHGTRAARALPRR